MSKMAADFLQSNLFDPTAPTEQYLQRTKWRRNRGDEESHRRLQMKDFLASVSDQANHNHCNNNNSYTVTDYNKQNVSRRVVTNKPSSKNTQNVVTIHPITKPMIDSLLSDGLVRLPGPPDHPRQPHLIPSNPRRNKRKMYIQKHQKQPMFIREPRELLFPETQLRNCTDVPCSQDQLLEKHLFPELKKLTDIPTDNKADKLLGSFKDSNEKDKNDKTNKVTTECMELKDSKSEDIDDMSDYIINDQKTSPVNKDTNTEFITETTVRCENLQLSSHTKSRDPYNKGLFMKSVLNESVIASDAFNLFQVQTELEKLNLINKSSEIKVKKKNTSIEVNSALFRETLGSCAKNNAKHSEVKVRGNHLDVSSTIQTKELEDSAQIYSVKRSKCYIKKISVTRKQLLRLLHLVLGIKWVKRSKQEDKKFLVEDEIIEGAAQNPEVSIKTKKKKKKATEDKQSLADHKATAKNKLDPDQCRDMKLSKSYAKKKKRRRLHKKNVSRVVSRIRRRLSYGCRYIGHGLVNMTSIIPEASYMGPAGYNRTFPTEYIYNEHYDPNAPDWHCSKGLYIKNPYK